jgi:hypothetical protein
MKKHPDPRRKLLASLLSWADAHVSFDRAVQGVPARLRGIRPKGLPYSLWELLEHIRLAQRDILDFCINPKYRAKKWPDDYWPGKPAPPNAGAWRKSVAAVRVDRRALQKLALDASIDLDAPIPHGDGQAYAREILLAADHAAYHVGEIITVRRLLGAWKPA